MSNSGIHKDHRERMRRRFRENGFDGFRDHEILEMMLFSVIPRRNTNDIAHGLLSRFGSIPAVISADTDELCKVDGIGGVAAERIRFIGELFCKIGADLYDGVPLTSEDSVGMYAVMGMGLAPADSACAVYLDGTGSVISREELAVGKDKMAAELQSQVLEKGRLAEADTLVLIHSHKGEPLTPSPDDVAVTEELRRRAPDFGIGKVYHVIVSDDGYIHI